MLAGGLEHIINMSLTLFHEVPVGAIKTLFDEQNQPMSKRTDLRKYPGILDIRHNFKELDWYFVAGAGIKMGGGETPSRFGMLGGGKNPHDVFATLDGTIKIAARSKRPNAVTLVKWLTKKGVKKIQEGHQHVIEEKDAALQGRDNQIQAI